MVDEKVNEEELINLAKDTAERLRVLTLRLEAYAVAAAEQGGRRQGDDNA